MKLEDAWLTLLDMDTTVVRTPSQIYSILSDLGVFKDYPKIRLAVNSALQNGLWELVSSNSVSQTDIDKLKSSLEYDGFSDVIIDEIINSFYTSPKSGSNNSQQPAPSQTQNNANSKPSSLTFLGIHLGCKLEEFIAKLPKDYRIDQSDSKFHITDKDIKTWLFDNQDSKDDGIGMLKYVSRVRCWGDFAGLRNCKIEFHYCPFSEFVYEITIMNTDVRDTVFNAIYQAYTKKYGAPTSIDKGEERKFYKSSSWYEEYDKIIFSISKFETIQIIIQKGMMISKKIEINYLDSRWADYDDAKIKQKQEELASKMQNKIIDGI